jgi:site-specific recombinase XerD
MDIAVAVRGYELDLQEERKSPRTITWYLSKLRYFARFLEDEFQVSDLGDVGPEHIKAFVRQAQAMSEAMDGVHHLKEGVLSSLTVHGYFVSIKAFLGWAEREEYIESSPATRLRPPKTRQVVIESLTPDKIKAMLKGTLGTRHGKRNYAMSLS